MIDFDNKSSKSTLTHILTPPTWQRAAAPPPTLPAASLPSRSIGGEVFVKIDGNKRAAALTATDFSFKSPRNDRMKTEDPLSQPTRKFLHKKNNSGTDMDFDVEVELQKTPPSKKVSFEQPTLKKQSSSSDSEGGGGGSSSSSVGIADTAEVVRCTANSYSGYSGLLRSKTKSRLMDPPPLSPRNRDAEHKSSRVPRSNQIKSSMLGSVDEDEDDDSDIPDDFKRDRISLLTYLQWAILVLVLAGLACTFAITPARRFTLWSLRVWKWEVLTLVLICGRLVSGWGIRIAIFFVVRSFLLRKRVLYFVYGVRRAVQNSLWLGLVILSWYFLFDRREERGKALPYVTKSLFCLLVATLLWLIKTLLVKVLASSFHVSTYFDRIQESLFNQYVLETLIGPPLIEIEYCQEEEEHVWNEVQKFQNEGATVPNDLWSAALPPKSGRVIGDSLSSSAQGTPRSSPTRKSSKRSGVFAKKDGLKQQDERITIDKLRKLNRNNVSAWNMKRMMRIVRHGALTTLEEQIPQASREDESAVTIRSEEEAKIAGKKIFQNVAKPGAKHIYLVDLMRLMRVEEALKTMCLFEEAKENKRISKKSLKDWVVNAFRERRALALTLNDTKTAVNKLHQMANVLVVIIVIVIWLLILEIATTKFFVFLSSQFLLAVFVFGNTLKMIFESIIFLFVMHPFDVGDRCEVEGNQMIVEEMNILTTVFLKADNTKISYPNTLLAAQPISNFHRSPDQGDAIDFCVHVSTPMEKLTLMKQKIIGFLESKKDYWYPEPMIVLRDVDDMNRLKISIWLRHRINFQDMGLKFTRRELILQELIRVLREQDIEYRMLPLDVNYRSSEDLSPARLPSNWTSCG